MVVSALVQAGHDPAAAARCRATIGGDRLRDPPGHEVHEPTGGSRRRPRDNSGNWIVLVEPNPYSAGDFGA